ncbi:MAG: adenylosuccinate synthetase [Parcubacteria group bacterium]|nr:adenylosuccinate synthetase [Parcubacteria group bacterium]
MTKTRGHTHSKNAFVVTGLGYGDEGKGTVTDWLSWRHKAHTIIRTGGPQALHRVVSKDGTSHVFSQFGSGTLRDAKTHLSEHMVIDPHAILREGEVLVHGCGIRTAFDTMTIHKDALVITPFSAIAGRVRELLRGKNRRGSVGIGVGETVLDSEVLKEGAIRAGDLNSASLRQKLEAIQRYKWAQFEAFADRASDVPNDVRDRVLEELREMEDPDTVEWAVEQFTELARRVRIVDTDYVAREILGPEGTVVFEGSQGVLLDRRYGFHPYITKVRTTPHAAQSILRECSYDGDVKNLGILRAYHTRHGAGPFVTQSKELTAQLPDATNKEHPWQGSFRVGQFDMVAARYALEASSEAPIDGLVITCLDRVWPQGFWQVCDTYDIPHDVSGSNDVFRFEGGSIVGIRRAIDDGSEEHLLRQEKIGRMLLDCVPRITTHRIPQGDAKKEFINLCVSTLERTLGVPVVAVSVGETEEDKIEIEKGQ